MVHFPNPDSSGSPGSPGSKNSRQETRQKPEGVAGRGPEQENRADGLLRAMSPGVVDYLFRQLVSGGPAEDLQWDREGTPLSAQAPGGELARRLAETDLDALTPAELFHYVRAAQRLASWAESLREAAVGRYCAGKDPRQAPGGACVD